MEVGWGAGSPSGEQERENPNVTNNDEPSELCDFLPSIYRNMEKPRTSELLAKHPKINFASLGIRLA